MIISAKRAPARVHKSRASSAAGYVGLLYERKVVAALRAAIPKSMKLEHNPWFYYSGRFAPSEGGTSDETVYDITSSACAPDVLIHDGDFGYIIVIEIKNTWTPTALTKLRALYCPVVSKALGQPTRPLVLVKNLTPEAPHPQSSITFSLLSQSPLLQWLGRGPISL